MFTQTHTCPTCAGNGIDLRFALRQELADHMRADHGAEVEVPNGADLYGTGLSS